ncbi:hypothetical protein AB0G04_36205 [Actinoplanes sp. NPDC023801]|uniref:hypothetical protein n=1 Tax=Actinoplanes sp. NPDC023801 TaxID=3154595 RepID=UPI0033DC6091
MSDLSRRSLLAGGAALLLTGCSSEEKKPLINEEDAQPGFELPGAAPKAALRAILERRARAVRDRDEAAFLADLDLDQSQAALVKQQKMLFGNLRQFTFKTFDYVIPESVIEPKVKDGLFLFPVAAIEQFPIDDAGTGALPGEMFQYTVREENGKYLIRDIVAKTSKNYAALDVAGPFAEEPWNTTPLTVIKVGDIWLAADASVTDLSTYARAANAEAEQIDKLWGDRTRYPGTLLFFTRDEESFRTWYGFGEASNFKDTIEGIAPFSTGLRTNGSPFDGQFTGSRVVMNLQRIDAFDDDPRRVMRHELAHGITARARNAGFTLGNETSDVPRWAVEGFARWTETVGNPKRAAAVLRYARQGFTGRLPRSKDFYGKKMGQHYAVGATAFLFAEKLKGTAAAVDFYAAVIQHTDVADLVVAELPVFSGICRSVLGLDSTAFYRQWSGFVRNGR